MTTIAELKEELKNKTDVNPEKYYPVDVLKEEGYIRRKCIHCGKYFWTLTNDDFCGEPECSGGYKFIKKPIGKKMDFIKSWEFFSSFFNKKGYTPIRRYPVAARWREDTDFVQASIYDFQPYVVTGDIEPLANPLVVPQYCVRFNSIDSVGITGRHNTGFVMIGQHAFFPDSKFQKSKYFRDLFEWLVKGITISKDELKIIENQWGGGGNLGVCMEFFARGLELANQVYMLYKVTPTGYENLKLKVLDMGMGQDRISWITNGTPTIYEVDYPIVCKKLYEKTGYCSNEIYESFIPYGSLLDVDSHIQLDKEWTKIANKIDIDAEELKKSVLPLAALYSIADHTQTLLVAVHDGVLPSNVGGGYNLRVILRRALSFIEKYGWNVDLIDICEWHAKYLLPQYPELIEKLDDLQEILEYEKSKYNNTLQNAEKQILRMIERNIQPTEEELYTLYESKGIMPETVKNLFEKHRKCFNIPPDFYSKLTFSHLKENIDQKKEEELKIGDIKDTEILYYKPIYDFYAVVLKSWSENERHFCILDRTAFYPKSGGQDCDIGKIDSIEVIKVEKYGKVIVHETLQKIKEDKGVHCVINRERRELLTKMHTATHIINGAAKRLLGEHVWQAGSEITIEKARLDITHYERLSSKAMDKLNGMANEIITENRKVLKKMMKRNEAEGKYGFTIYQGGAVPGKELRIIEIENYDTEACGGSHGNFSSEVEEILIFNNHKIQDGILRLEFVAGKELCEENRKKLELEKRKEKERAKKKIEEAKLKRRFKKIAKKEAKESNIKIDSVIILKNKSGSELKSIGRAINKEYKEGYLILLSEGIIYGIKSKDCEVDIEKVVEIASKILGGSYGGKNNEWLGGGPFKDKTEFALESVRKYLRTNT